MSIFIRQAQFTKTITHPAQAPPTKPAVVFAGRSNVGKSSLLNKLVGIKRLARTSTTPGRTREINYFEIEEQYYFIDLPGYGYAKVSQSLHRLWGPMIEQFFRKAEGLRLIVQILDVRRDPNAEDLQMIAWLEEQGIPFIFAVTKCDKMSRGQMLRRLKELQKLLGLEDDSSLVPVSSQTGSGIEDLLRVIRGALEGNASEGPDPKSAGPEIDISIP